MWEHSIKHLAYRKKACRSREECVCPTHMPLLCQVCKFLFYWEILMHRSAIRTGNSWRRNRWKAPRGWHKANTNAAPWAFGNILIADFLHAEAKHKQRASPMRRFLSGPSPNICPTIDSPTRHPEKCPPPTKIQPGAIWCGWCNKAPLPFPGYESISRW